jgi:hypothetical protein
MEERYADDDISAEYQSQAVSGAEKKGERQDKVTISP